MEVGAARAPWRGWDAAERRLFAGWRGAGRRPLEAHSVALSPGRDRRFTSEPGEGASRQLATFAAAAEPLGTVQARAEGREPPGERPPRGAWAAGWRGPEERPRPSVPARRPGGLVERLASQRRR